MKRKCGTISFAFSIICSNSRCMFSSAIRAAASSVTVTGIIVSVAMMLFSPKWEAEELDPRPIVVSLRLHRKRQHLDGVGAGALLEEVAQVDQRPRRAVGAVHVQAGPRQAR